MTERMTSLTVYTLEAEEGLDVIKILNDIGAEMALNHQSVTVSTHKMGDRLDGDDDPDELYHDENTLMKVREALGHVLVRRREGWTMDELVTDLIGEMQNAGILFRERRR